MSTYFKRDDFLTVFFSLLKVSFQVFMPGNEKMKESLLILSSVPLPTELV